MIMDNIRGSYPEPEKREIKTLEFERTPSPFTDSTYASAFKKATNTQSAFKVERVYGNGHALVFSGDVKYIVASLDDLRNMIRGWLLHEPFLIPVDVLINVISSYTIHGQSDFYLRMLDKNLESEDIRNLDCALSISRKFNSNAAFWMNSGAVFWKTIERVDEVGLYGKCVQCLFETPCSGSWLDKLIDTYVSWGQEYLCEVKGGLFEAVALGEGEQNWFYVYEIETERVGYKNQ